MKDYVAAEWAALLRYNELDSFTALWNHQQDHVEAPNQRRGGWSSVCCCILKTPQGEQVRTFLKRQENHVYRPLWHPIRGRLSSVREMRNIRRFQRYGIPGPEPIYFAQRIGDGNQQAVLMMADLQGYTSLASSRLKEQPLKVRRHLCIAVARVLRHMHHRRLQHNCFYPKHIFFKILDDESIEVRVIDLEKAKRRLFRRFVMLRDLDTLNRYTSEWHLTDRLRFLQTYLQQRRSDKRLKAIWREIARRTTFKRTRKARRLNLLAQKMPPKEPT